MARKKTAKAGEPEEELFDEDEEISAAPFPAEKWMGNRTYPVGIMETERSDVYAVVCNQDHFPSEQWTKGGLNSLRVAFNKYADRTIVVDMEGVENICDGSFSVLRNGAEKVKLLLLRSPTANIRSLIWFRMYTSLNMPDEYRMHSDRGISIM